MLEVLKEEREEREKEQDREEEAFTPCPRDLASVLPVPLSGS